MARVDEAKKTSRARAHYTRTVCFKVRHGEAIWSPRRVWDRAPTRRWCGRWCQRFEQNKEPRKWDNSSLLPCEQLDFILLNYYSVFIKKKQNMAHGELVLHTWNFLLRQTVSITTPLSPLSEETACSCS